MHARTRGYTATLGPRHSTRLLNRSARSSRALLSCASVSRQYNGGASQQQPRLARLRRRAALRRGRGQEARDPCFAANAAALPPPPARALTTSEDEDEDAAPPPPPTAEAIAATDTLFRPDAAELRAAVAPRSLDLNALGALAATRAARTRVLARGAAVPLALAARDRAGARAPPKADARARPPRASTRRGARARARRPARRATTRRAKARATLVGAGCGRAPLVGARSRRPRRGAARRARCDDLAFERSGREGRGRRARPRRPARRTTARAATPRPTTSSSARCSGSAAGCPTPAAAISRPAPREHTRPAATVFTSDVGICSAAPAPRRMCDTVCTHSDTVCTHNGALRGRRHIPGCAAGACVARDRARLHIHREPRRSRCQASRCATRRARRRAMGHSPRPPGCVRESTRAPGGAAVREDARGAIWRRAALPRACFASGALAPALE